MRVLYHLWMSPQCRKVRIVLREKLLDFETRAENVLERRAEFLALNPAGDIRMEAGDYLIAMGEAKDLKRMEDDFER